jgi:hypothetical protein
VEALSLEVIQWRTRTLNNTGEVDLSKEHGGWSKRGNSLSMLQHIKHIHPGSPFRTITTVRLLQGSQHL